MLLLMVLRDCPDVVRPLLLLVPRRNFRACTDDVVASIDFCCCCHDDAGAAVSLCADDMPRQQLLGIHFELLKLLLVLMMQSLFDFIHCFCDCGCCSPVCCRSI